MAGTTDRHWSEDWPRCLLLLELARSHATSGRIQGCEKLLARLEEVRERMIGAPMPAYSLLSELCYIVWLLRRGEVAEARHHVAMATRKVTEVAGALQKERCAQALERGCRLQRRSLELQSKVRELLLSSARLIASSRELRARLPGQS